MAVTLQKISERFVGTDMKRDIAFLVQRCPHCASTTGGPPQARQLAEAVHADLPNELIHWNILFMGESDTKQEYVLVIKDDASKFVWLLSKDAADAEATFTDLLDCFASLGVSDLD
ncbi:unnamed protein product [Phytophthora fragariaefolia]|uniref:Unnamed protein product n=1 Tax=Phytophthora fragariaefolia TaxID=1490495 RepID=A0A9W6XCP5_9STRA|nr:unnamed protein product [Phytophthora fragariaefolia]